jgi:predicted phage-related endonuclease
MTILAQELPLTPFEVLADSNHKRDFWLEKRQLGIGASEIAIVLGNTRWGTSLSLYAKKLGLWKDNEEEKEYLYWGNRLEPAIIAGYADRTGRAAVPFGLLLRHVRYPWLLATPDALTTDDPAAKARAPELTRAINAIRRVIRHQRNVPPELVHEFVRCSQGWWALQTKNIGLWSAQDWTEGAPDYYVLQCQQESLLLNSTRCTAAALVAGQRLIWEDIERDEITERRIVNLGRKFWHEHVLAKVEPAADGSEHSARALKHLHPLANPETVLQLSAEDMDFAYQRDRVKDQLKALATEIDLMDNTIKQKLGNYERALLPDGTGYSYKTTLTREKTVVYPAGSYRALLRTHPKADKPKKPRKKPADND